LIENKRQKAKISVDVRLKRPFFKVEMNLLKIVGKP